MNVVDLLQRSVRLHPDNPSLGTKTDNAYRYITYQDLWKSVTEFRAGLSEFGVCPGDKVAILSTNCPEWAISDFGTLAAGAVVVPIYPSLPSNQVGYILENADVKVCIVQDEEQLEKIRSLHCPKLKTIIMITPAKEPWSSTNGPALHQYSDVLTMGRNCPPKCRFPSETEADSLATIVYTSGTSGTPKGVMLSHDNLVSNVLGCLEVAQVRSTDLGLSYLPLAHIFERTVGQFLTLTCGAAIAYAENIEALPKNLLEVRPTVLVTVPRLLEKVFSKVAANVSRLPSPVRRVVETGLNSSKATGPAYRLVDRLVYRKIRDALGGRIRLVVSGGAALSRDIAQFFMNAKVPLIEGYGMTECAPVISVNPPDDVRPGSVGKPIPGVQIKLADDGELLVNGPNVMKGYYNNELATHETVTNGWLHTGDIAELEDGYVRIVDRKKNILVLATGKNVAPAPVESAILMSPLVSNAVLLGDGRQYVSCLLFPDMDALRGLAKQYDIPGDSKGWVVHPEIQKRYAQEVRQQVEGFAPFEQPKRAILMPDELTVESGALTPTLKVRNSVVRQRYGEFIDNMYRGTDYIAIFDGPPHPEATDHPSSLASPSGEQLHAVRSFPRKRRIRRAIIATVTVCLVLGVIALAHPTLPKNLDILGMVKGIHQANTHIGEENRQIVTDLTHIDHLAGNTKNMATHLSTLNDGVTNDTNSLLQLRSLSEQEISLSKQFYSLAQSLQKDMTAIGTSSNKQSESLNQMNSTGSQVSNSLQRLVEVNQQMANQLESADSKAKTIANEMP